MLTRTRLGDRQWDRELQAQVIQFRTVTSPAEVGAQLAGNTRSQLEPRTET